MDVKKKGHGTMITLNQAFGDRIKLLNLSYGILFFLSGHLFLIQFIRSDKDPKMTLIYILVLLVMYIGSFRFLNKAILSEKLFIGPHELRLIRKNLFKSKSATFAIQKVANLRYIENKSQNIQRQTEPPNNLRSFLIGDPIIYQIGTDNRVAFDYENQHVFFGSAITSFEFDKIKSIFDHALSGGVLKK